MMSPMHLKYTTYMCGVNMVDQLRISYCMQKHTHKWWHKIFFFVLNMTNVNMFIIYLMECKNRFQKPISHLQFMVELCEVLLQSCELQGNTALLWFRSYCYPIFTELRKPCMVCNGLEVVPVIRSKTCCTGCNNKYMCFKKRYYKSTMKFFIECIVEKCTTF